MKTLLLTIAGLCLYIGTLSAQDTLLLKTGDELYVKVEKIDAATITYTLPPDSTIKTINKADVFMLKFANGLKYVMGSEAGKEITKQDIDKAVQQKLSITEYAKYTRTYERRKRTGVALMATGGTLVTLGGILLAVYIPASKVNTPYNSSYLGIIGGSYAMGASFPLLLSGTIVVAKLPKYKRKMDEAKQQLSFAPVTQPLQPIGNMGGNYTGLAMRINF